MGEIIKKSFKEPKSYYKKFIILSLLIIGCIDLVIGLCFFENQETFINNILNEDITGGIKHRYVVSSLKLIAQKFGISGLLMIPILVGLSLMFGLYKEIAEYRRYLYKCRLYHEGLIKNIYDIYDDYERKNIFRWIKDFFSRNNKKYKLRKPSKMEMRKIEREIENLR
jgi:hypothetical protein